MMQGVMYKDPREGDNYIILKIISGWFVKI